MPDVSGFDRAQRFALCADILRRVLAVRPTPPRVLDLGGFPGILADVLGADFQTLTVDQPPGRFPCYVRAEGSALPFPDAAFDAVVANDVLEHVPSDARANFLAEAARVARGWLVVGGPFRSSPAERAETTLNSLYMHLSGAPNAWLAEHLACGLPQIEAVRDRLARLGFPSAAVPSQSLEFWLLGKSFESATLLAPDAKPGFEALDRAWGTEPFAAMHAPPFYRWTLVAHRDGAAVERFTTESGTASGCVPPGSPAPEPSAEETQRVEALCGLLAALGRDVERRLHNAGGDALKIEYADRLERALEGAEAENAALRDELARYRGSRFIRFWRRLRGA